MKTNYKIAVLSVALLTVFSSCNKDFLETNPQNSTSVEEAIVDVNGMRAAIYGSYSLMQSDFYYGRSFTFYADVMSDNVYISSKNSGRYEKNDQYAVRANDSYARDTWNQIYKVIANSNVIIDKSKSVVAISTDSIERKQIIGEAYALRALAYHDLVRLYAQSYKATADASHWGVPLFTKAVYEKGSVENLGRSSVKEVYAQITKDLDSAISNLPERLRAKGANLDAKYKGRFNLFGAKALKARVALYMGDYATAVALTTEVINKKSLYTLLANDKLVSDFKVNNNTETIFEVINTNIDNMGTNSLVHFYNQSGYGDALATDDLYNAYTKTDVRRSFMQKGTRKDGETNAGLVIKYTSTSTRDESIKVLRLAEMYLIRAEANAKLGNDALALADINLIAKRGDKDAVDIVAPLEGLMDKVLAEGRKEFPFEGHRLFDLNRNSFNFIKYRTGGETINVSYPNQRVILPIPQAELDANPAIRSQQNPGYGGL